MKDPPPTFGELAWYDRSANFAGLTCSAIAMLFLLLPASYHRFTARLEETEAFLAFARRSIGMAFVFIPLAVAFSVYVPAVRTFGSAPFSLALASALLLMFAVGWWILPLRRTKVSR